MTKTEFIESLATDQSISNAEAKRNLDMVLDSLVAKLHDDEVTEINLAPLGKFVKTVRAARVSRNPKTGEPVNVPAKNVVVFRASKELKKNL